MTSDLLISFYGDDFTGSTDAMESLARAGLRTVLFTVPPTSEQLGRYPGLRAFGVAGMTRSMPPAEMERALRPALGAIRACGVPVVHYKVCSTFDSSPTVGSIGRAIDVGADVFGSRSVPVVVGAPSLGRHCVFGNLFARCGAESEPYRLDRHPSMSRHPVTPMGEADLRLHLAKQTEKPIGLVDVVTLDGPRAADAFDETVRSFPVVLIDLLAERQLAMVGALLDRHASRDAPLYVVGSSGVESALSAHWQARGVIGGAAVIEPVRHAGPIVVAAGSCSPVTMKQIDWALGHGFDEVVLDAPEAEASAAQSVRRGRSVIVHTDARRTVRPDPGSDLGAALGRTIRRVLEAAPVRRVLVAGGDTSGRVAHALGIESLEMVGELTRGAPLCRAAAPGSPADGVEITFKGGQIGAADFFGLVEQGVPAHG